MLRKEYGEYNNVNDDTINVSSVTIVWTVQMKEVRIKSSIERSYVDISEMN